MEEDEEDRLLLSRLGITSANPEDIEHELLRKVETHSTPEDKKENENPSQDAEDLQSNIRSKLYSRLQAVKTEIDAVAASIDNSKTTEENVADASTHGNIDIENDLEHRDDSNQVTSDGFSVQHALAVDRLKSLKRTKAKLQNEIARLDESVSTESIENSSLIEKLVKETPKSRKLKESQSSESTSYLKLKSVAYEDDDDFDAVLDATSTGFVETEREKMVRKGLMTPFHKLRGLERRVQVPPPQTVSNPSYIDDDKSEHLVSSSIAKAASAMSNMANARSSTKLLDANSLPTLDGPTRPFHRLKTPLKRPISPTDDIEKKQKVKRSKRPLPGKKWRANVTLEDRQLNEAGVDESDNLVDGDYDGQVEGYADDGESSVIIEGGFKIPGAIYNQLFDYQKVGVQWLWELHCQRAGGIIGDEMGLGKTIQVISFLAALHFSNMYKPSIVICPVTLLRQWQREARKWYPKFHVEILHDSAHGLDKRSSASSSGSDDDSEKDSPDSKSETPSSGRSIERWNYLLDRVLNSNSGLLLTSYEQLRILGEKLLDIEWGYAILDEGHRIRNPNAEVTLVCKQLQTVHRIIMTGAPIQNKLSELWSLFDFIFPGKLGVLPVFEREFAVPITVGGYANATPLQVSTAYRCAVVLRDLIMPYLLRRMKADVNAHLPKKIEHVLFCSLTDEQRSTYRAFLASSEVEQIFDGRRNSLYGIDVMRKICNHPDLLEREYCGQHLDYGNPERSGKMKVVAQVLDVWKEQGHRVLIFSQTQQMLDILEKILSNSGFIYRRMDGLTPVKQRMALIDEFNNSTEVFVFILTTKVGGLGTNLIGANRVIIYDPDWNPSTDMQARERAWRIGQTKDVTIYRLITRGTIEEKVYHRQIYKHFLTNKILKNPKQRRFFKARDMRDLFTLQDDGKAGSTETSDIFSQLSGAVNVEVRDDTKGDTRGKEKLAAYGAGESKSEASVSGIPDRKGKEAANENGSSMDEETNVLKSLFGAQGIHSALNHDAIVDANDDDRLRLEEQASLVAQKAAEALRQSRIIRSQESFSVPTWTGKSGAAGAPSSVRRKFGSAVNSNLLGSSKVKPEGSSSGPGLIVGATTGKTLSSAELLAKTRGNQENAINHAIEHQLGSSLRANAASESRAKPSSKLTVVQPEVLIRQLCTFIHQRGGSAESSIIVEHFKDRVPQKDLPLFRNLLKEIAALEKGADGSRWVLKAEYRE